MIHLRFCRGQAQKYQRETKTCPKCLRAFRRLDKHLPICTAPEKPPSMAPEPTRPPSPRRSEQGVSSSSNKRMRLRTNTRVTGALWNDEQSSREIPVETESQPPLTHVEGETADEESAPQVRPRGGTKKNAVSKTEFPYTCKYCQEPQRTSAHQPICHLAPYDEWLGVQQYRWRKKGTLQQRVVDR